MNREMRALRQFLAGQPDRAGSLAEERRKDREAAARLPLPREVRIDSIELGGVPVDRVAMPHSNPNHAVLHFHAGAYVFRSAFEYRPFGAALAAAAAATVYLVDYRLAPEYPFPAAFNDALASYRGLAEKVGASQIVVGGDSAGGGLALALAMALRNTNQPPPAGLILASPWADLTCSSETYRTLAAADPRVRRDRLMAQADLYLAGADARDPRASPALGRLDRLPPALVLVGSDEAMLGDALMVYGGIRAAGGEARLEVWPDMIHVWHLCADRLEAGRQAIARMGDYCRRSFDPALPHGEIDEPRPSSSSG